MGETGGDYVRRKGWRVLRTENRAGKGKQLVMDCPLCGAEGKFAIGEDSGLWGCWKCDAGGNLLTLKAKMDDLPGPSAGSRQARDALSAKLSAAWSSGLRDLVPSRALDLMCEDLHADPEAVAYLQGRGINRQAAKMWRLGLAVRAQCTSPKCRKRGDDKNGARATFVRGHCTHCRTTLKGDGLRTIAMPYLINGKVVNVKFRALAEKRFERELGGDSVLYACGPLVGGSTIAVCEAELDAISLWQLGLRPVVALPTGAGGLQEAWVDQLSTYDEILIVTDPDEAGEKGAQKLAEALGPYRCRRVELPDDANACLAAGMTEQDLQVRVGAAKAMGSSPVKHFSELRDSIRMLLDPAQARGETTGFPELDRLMGGGLRPGEVTVLTGYTGEGKSTLLTRIALNRATYLDGVMIATFEDTPSQIGRKMLSMLGEVPAANMDEDQFEVFFGEMLSKMRIYYVDSWEAIGLKQLSDSIEYGVRRYKLRLLTVDHLHFLMNGEEDEVKALGHYTRELKRVAMRYGIHVMMVVHPKRTPENKLGRRPPVQLHHMKGASAIEQNCDNALAVELAGDQTQSRARVRTLKVRSELGIRDGSLTYEFDRAKLAYKLWEPPRKSGG